jgi:hypothetical protein
MATSSSNIDSSTATAPPRAEVVPCSCRVRLPATTAARLPGVSFSVPQVISGFSSSPSVSTKPHGRRDEPAPDGSTELACRPAPGAGNGPRSARHPASGLGELACSAAWSGRAPTCCVSTHGVSASWAGNAHRVVSSSERRRPRRACHWPLSADRSGQQVVACTGWHPPLGGVGRDDTVARDCEGRRCGYHPVAYRRTCRVAERGHPHGSEQFISRRAVRFGDRGGRGVHVHLRPEMGAVMLWPSASAVGWLPMMTALIVLARSGTARWEREQERGAGTGATRPTSEPTTEPAPSRGSPGR